MRDNAKKYARIRAVREARRNQEIGQLFIEGGRRVKGFEAYIVMPSGLIYSTYGRRVLCLRPGVKPGGYEFVGMKNEAGTKYRMVHRVVAETFIPNPDNLPAVNHKDGNKRNNCVTNLEWCSYADNSAHAVRLGLIPTGPTHHLAKLDERAVQEIRAASGTYRDIGAKYGICAQSVCRIKRRETYRTVPEEVPEVEQTERRACP